MAKRSLVPVKMKKRLIAVIAMVTSVVPESGSSSSPVRAVVGVGVEAASPPPLVAAVIV